MFGKNSAWAYFADFLLLTAAASAACFMPAVSILCTIFLPVFFMILTVRRPLPAAIAFALWLLALSAALFCAQSGFTGNALFHALLSACALSLPGLAMGLWLQRSPSLFQIIGLGTAANIFAILLQIGKIKWIDHIDFMEVYINQPIAALIGAYQQQLLSYGGEYASLAEALDKMVWVLQQLVGMLIPAGILIFCLFLTYTTFLIARKALFCLYRIVFPDVLHFGEIQPNRYTAIVFAVLFLLSVLLGASPAGHAAINLVLLLGAVYLMAGVSCIDFYFRRTGLRSGIRMAIYIAGFFALNLLSLVLPLFHATIILVLLGLMDSFFDFRRLRRKEGTLL